MARIVFDLDGTLIDSAPDIHAAANTLLAREGADPVDLAQTRGFIGNGADIFVQRLRGARGIGAHRHAAMLAGFLALYEDAVHLTRPYEGVRTALETLARAGHRLGICTTSRSAPAGRCSSTLTSPTFSRPCGAATALMCASRTRRR